MINPSSLNLAALPSRSLRPTLCVLIPSGRVTRNSGNLLWQSTLRTRSSNAARIQNRIKTE
jgi:hypothetical protein